MSRSLAKLLKDSIELAEVQLDAARSLDHEALQEATDARSDLLFKLQALAPDGLDAAAQDERTRELALELAELDYRLNRILGAALRTFERLIPKQDGPETYSAAGRLRGGTG
jgi:hypothetical protein